jgi:hypothetical protein
MALRDTRGQLLIPSLMCMASFFLFVILIFEVGRLSRDKIRQQFALDAAASIEMEQYTDLLNRLAYLNGVFPDRVFREVYGANWAKSYIAGLFPAAPNGVSPEEPVWPIRFGPGRNKVDGNSADPPLDFGQLHMNPEGAEGAVPIDDATMEAYGYIKIYQWLGDIATAQKLVFESTVLKRHALLRKSLWMNLQAEEADAGSCSGDIQDCGDEAAKAFRNILLRTHFLRDFKYCGLLVPVGSQMYIGVMDGSFSFGINGLWQLTTVPEKDLSMLRRGFVVKNHWSPKKNFFNVDFKEHLPEPEDPFVQVTAITKGGRVWPDSTPKYSSRLLPGCPSKDLVCQ